jgi:hypothetical protein
MIAQQWRQLVWGNHVISDSEVQEYIHEGIRGGGPGAGKKVKKY